MKFLSRIVISALFVGAFVTLLPAGSAAALDCTKAPDFDTPTCKSGGCAVDTVKDSTLCKSLSNNTNPVTGSGGILTVATKFVSYLVGVTSIIGVLVGGIRYTMASGDANSVSAAKKMIIYALVGIVVALFAQALVILVLR